MLFNVLTPAGGLLNAAKRVDGTAELALQGAGVVLGVSAVLLPALSRT